jgi:hypothetical protein
VFSAIPITPKTMPSVEPKESLNNLVATVYGTTTVPPTSAAKKS